MKNLKKNLKIKLKRKKSQKRNNLRRSPKEVKEKTEEKKIEVSVGVDIPLKIDLDSMDESEKTEMADSIANGMRSDLEKLNPFEGGTTEVTAELVKVEGDQAVNRRRREVAAAVAEVEAVYSTPPGADLAAVEIPEQNDLANQFTEAAKVALSSEAFKDVVDETQLENLETTIEVDLPSLIPRTPNVTQLKNSRPTQLSLVNPALLA